MEAELLIFNLKGQKVKTLLKGSLEKGLHTIKWNGIDDRGKSVSSGVYFYRLKSADNQQIVKKCLLLK